MCGKNGNVKCMGYSKETFGAQTWRDENSKILGNVECDGTHTKLQYAVRTQINWSRA